MHVGDLALSYARTADVKAMLTLLKQRRIAGRDLTAYKGRTTSAVKVGTYTASWDSSSRRSTFRMSAPASFPPQPKRRPVRSLEAGPPLIFRRHDPHRDRLVITWSERAGFLASLIERERGRG
jgi:hypothetical protein